MITIQQETFRPFLEEVKPLFPLHWAELALEQDRVPLNPRYDEYLRRDDAGQVLSVTVRDEGELVGYFVGFIAPGLHYQTCLTLTMDIFWLHPKSRGQNAGWYLFKHVQRVAKERGVQRMLVGSKLHKDASWLFERLGYEPIETYYSTWLGD